MQFQHSRRSFLANTAAIGASLAFPGFGLGRTPPPPAANKKLAAIVTAYHHYSHADDIVTKMIEGYCIKGKDYPPPCKVASLYIDQTPADTDVGKPIAKYWDIPVVKSIAESLTLGGDKLAVDGVLLIAEQGDYPTNDKGQKLYPRRKFFEEVLKVFRASKKSVPVYLDKHFSYSWDEAKWMYDQSRELGFPMMAGSSVPVADRSPELYPKIGVEWDRALSVGFGHFETYGFHMLEALQVMVERRKGGETGVKAVQCLSGKEAWAAANSKWDRKLLDEALSKMPDKWTKTVDEDDKEALVYLIEYRDGFQAAAYMSPRHVREFAFAGQIKGEKSPVACYFRLPKPQRDHFSYLTTHIGKMMATGKPTYPVERTLLTTGMLAALMDSKADGGKRIETPHLKVEYQAVDIS